MTHKPNDPPTRPVNLAIPSGDFDPEAPCPGDTAALLRLRECIDDHGVWPTRETEEAGNYELCVRWMAEEIRQLRDRVKSAERSRQCSTLLAAQTHYMVKHLVELTEPAARLYEFDQMRKPVMIPASMVEEFRATIDAPASPTEKPKGNRPT